MGSTFTVKIDLWKRSWPALNYYIWNQGYGVEAIKRDKTTYIYYLRKTNGPLGNRRKR